MERDSKSKEIYQGGKRKVTAVGFLVVMATCRPWTQLGNQRGGKPAGVRACPVPKYTPSGKRNYKPVEMVGMARAGTGHQANPPTPQTM